MDSEESPKRELSFIGFLSLYLGLLAFIIGVPILAAPYLGIRPGIGIMGLFGSLCLLGATRHPWWLYETLRSPRGWGIGLPDRHVQLYLAVLGILSLGLAVFAIV